MLLTVLSLVLLTAPASEQARPAVAITVPHSAKPEYAWLGYALADTLSNRLLVHGRVDPKSLQRTYPLNVFGWRQSQSAARAEGIASTNLVKQEASQLRAQLGADYLWTATYAVNATGVVLQWQLLGDVQHTGQVAFDLEHITEGSEQLASDLLAKLGESPSALLGHKPSPVPLATFKSYGQGLQILAAQSLDPRARLVLPKQDMARAHTLFSAATAASPSFVFAWVERGVVSAMLNELGRSEEELVQALVHSNEFEPATAVGTYYLYERQNKLGEGIKLLADTTASHLGFLQGLGYLGEAYVRAGMPHEALKVFTSYATRVPKSPWAQVKRGFALTRIGRTDLAVTETRALLKRFPKSLMIKTALISRHIDAGDFASARATLVATMAEHPNHPTLLTRASYLALAQNKPKEALETAQQAVAVMGDGRGEPMAGYAHVNLAHALALLGQRKEAFVSLRQALSLGVGGEELAYMRRDTRLTEFLRDPRCPPQVLAIAH